MKKLTWIFCCCFIAAVVSAQDATLLYNEGLKLKEQKKSAEAAAKFEKAVALKLDYTEARYEWGWCQNDLKQYEAAITNLRKVRIAWPAYLKVHFELGWAFEKTKQYGSALAEYNICIELKSSFLSPYKQITLIYYNREDYENSLEYYRRCEAVAQDSIKDHMYWYRKGFMQNALKDFTAAVESLNLALQYNRTYLNTWLELGFAYSRLKRDDDAIRYYTEAMRLDPKSHIPLNGIAEVYRDNKRDIEEAMKWYRKVLVLNPTERKACFGMGYCLNSQQKFSDAVTYLTTAIRSEPTYTAAFAELGYSYYKVGLYTDAIRNLSKAMELNPANENSRYYLALVYIDLKEKVKAQEVVDQLRKLSSKHVATLQPKVDAMK